TEDLAVGVKVIDMQHRELFKRINDLLQALSEGKEAEEVEKTFDFLEDYIDSHFVSEEKAMAIYSYPEIKSHMIQHGIFRDAFFGSKEKYSEIGADPDLMSEVKFRICDWIVTHVARVDKELGEFLIPKIEEMENEAS
ncbi:MAG: bacteriohemerythrin, partial [Thermodesulfobacteriota bacterium]